MDDTSPAERERYFDLLRATTVEQRAARTVALCRAVREAALVGLRAIHPDAGERELEARLADRLYGPAVARRFYGAGEDELA